MPEEMLSPAAATVVGPPEGPPEPVAADPGARAHRLNGLLARYGLLAAFVLTVIVFSIARPDTFPTMENLKSILTAASPPLIIAAGLTVVLVMQDFDLSFGAMIGLASGAAIALAVTFGWSWEAAMLAALGLGLVAGLVNGYLVAVAGGSSFIVTLAMGTVLTGIEYAITSQNTIYSGVSQDYVDIASGTILGLSNMIWIAAVLAAGIWLLLDRTEIGRFMYAIGGNPEAARLSGIRVRTLRTIGFVIVGLSAAVVGILITSQSGSYTPNSGVSYLLPAFAAAFLGSAVFRPGEFNLPGTVVGVLFLGVIQTGLTMLDLQTYIINLVQGGILVTAVLVSRLGQRSA